MKNFYLISIFTFFCFQFSLAQYNYEKNWEKVETLELKGKLASANRILQRIHKKAATEQNAEQLVKSFVYSAKFSLLITEASEVTVLESLQKEIAKQSFPTNAILENIYARFLFQYFKKYQYKIRSRSSIASDTIPADLSLWNARIFITQIHKHFQHSIQKEKTLLQLPVEDYMAFLDGKENTKIFRSSLYDILVYNMLEFYKNEIPYNHKRGDSYTYGSNDFLLGDAFLKRKFDTTDFDEIARTNTMQLFQKLEKIYKNNKEAYLDIVLQRLAFVRGKTSEQLGRELYVKALEELTELYKNDPVEALIQYEIAGHYFKTSSTSYRTYLIPNFDQLRVDALAITEAMVAKYPTSEGGIKCQLLKKNILRHVLSFKMESFSVPNKPSLAQVKLRSVDSILVNTYRIPHTFLENIQFNKRDSVIRDYINNHKVVLEQLYLPEMPKDYYQHTTELSIPALPLGRYLVLFSDVSSDEKGKNIFSYTIIQKTNLSETITELNDENVHTIVHRETGKPIHNATIKVFDKKKIINQIARTDWLGNARIRKREGKRSIKKFITFKNDTLYTNNTSLGYNYEKGDTDENTELKAKPFIFTDRSIYRPGQTMYFKGILLQQKNGVSSVVPNVYCQVILESQESELKTFRLKTNEYGSFSGSFKIPKNGITGEYLIEVDEDDDYEEEEHPFWDYLDEFDATQFYFQVEEYKRPRFEVTLDELTKNIKFKDSVKITGKAKALLGSAITNAKVSYSVNRSTNIAYQQRKKYPEYLKETIIAEETIQTDAKGNFTIPFATTIDETIDIKDLYAYSYEVSIEVIDLNGETQTAEKTIIVNSEGVDFRLEMPWKSDRKNPLEITINARDVNRVPVTINGNLKIYKLKSPERIVRKRPWDFPEIQTLSKAAFVKQFPHDSYTASENKDQWEKGALVANVDFNTEKNTKHTFNATSWTSGSYIVEGFTFDETVQDTIFVDQKITLTNIDDTYLPDQKLFEYTVLNTDYRDDGYVKLKLSTALRDDTLNVQLHLFHKEKLVLSQATSIDKGSKIVKIPVDKSFTESITIRMSHTKFNSFDYEDFTFSLYEENKFLDIKTSTFRNKLQPGQKETWRFKILDVENKGSNAEILASMYDESLDQFKRHSWDLNFYYFNRSRYSTPRVEDTYFDVSHSNKFYNITSEINIPNFRNYLRFNWFGLNFNNLLSTNYKHIKRLKEKKKTKHTKASSGTISGHIFDEDGLPLPGAAVVIKGTSTGTITDFDGLYTINASADDTLVISYVGFTSQEIPIEAKNNINVSLQGDMSQLEEVTVVAYGISTRHVSSVAALITVNGESVSTIRDGRLDQILQGSSAGLNISTGSGQPGANGVIIIRGTSSLQQNNAPLFVVDGVPVDENAFKNLNQNNITSMSVLKDAGATALYGARGANGVVIITTKYGTRTETIDGMQVIVGLTEEDLDTVETRKDLNETAFFYPHLRTDSEGNVLVEFEAPESLTRWKFQLVAHQKDGIFGSIEKNAVTQKELMVVPNMPRFLREKDTIVITSKIVNLQNKATKGIASLRLFDALTMESIDAKIHLEEKNKSFTIDAKGNTNVSWKLYIPEGFDAIQYRVIAKSGNFSDGEESALPVLKNSILVTEAKPIWVKAGEEKEVTFSKLANNTSASLKQHKLTLEYTSNPTWSAIQSLPYLLEYPYECAEQTFSRLYANVLVTHILQSSPKIKEVFESWKANGQLVSDLEKNSELKSLLISETPWVRDAASETEKKQRLAQLFDPKLLEEQQLEMWLKLEDLQKSSGGFPWFAGGNENGYITLHILQTYAHLVKLNVITDKKSDLYSIMKNACKYADVEFLKMNSENLKSPSNENYVSQLRYLYIRSLLENHINTSKDVKRTMNRYLDVLQKDWILLSLEQKAMLALSLERMGKHSDAKKIMNSLEETAVKTTESGMYWKEFTNSRYYSSSAIEKQALLIEAFSEITKNDEIVQELQLWLLQQKQTSQWATTKATTKAIYALLLNPKEFVSIKDNTIVTVGTEKINTKKLNETEKEAGTGYFKTSWNKAAITKDKATIKIQNNGKTASFGGVYWQYFEELENITQNDNVSLQVTKELYVKENINNEEALVPLAKKSLTIGDLITVRLTITNTKNAEFIHLKDMRAAGLEPVNVLSRYKWQDGIGYYESTRDASTNFFFDRIPKGIFILEYEVRVNNSGEFSNGITTIESMYAPEFRSHTKGIRIKVE
ncbi:carboxypeptidase-like regulatory domain-containing protein [Kordia sp. YSTF-M3]|uniref:Carboxypeptidase-like regulatory domain-containing protein n=1 Tax=Kordia aestuariivivens TaxID=2759037 RepID=A0ABR7QAY7_9FLAO|nr:carboxypeptidase-like regulatory domain-containing protein [Kordia aestuariivivens]MBC8755744.1 carboxypeptidase-like regulatory domain-containing protein [Kordia aestuariivivens]